jgi:hypothetical protein
MSSASIVQGSIAAPKYPRSGSAVIAAGASTSVVVDTAITANSVVVCCGLGAADGTALRFSVDVVSAGVGFTLRSNANATAAKSVGFVVLQY